MAETTDAAFDDVAAITDFANTTDGVWQSFTAIGALNLRAVELYAKTPDGGGGAEGVAVIIRNGTGTGGAIVTQLTSATVAETLSPAWIRFQFPDPYVALVPAAVYTIQISGSGAQDFLWGYALTTPFTGYSGGVSSFLPDSDLFFRVKVIPSDVNPDVDNTFDFVETNDNTAAAPAYRFISDGATGMYLPAAGELGFTTAGTAAATIDAVGNLRPAVDDTMSLGTTGLGGPGRWLNAFFGGMFQGFYARDFPLLSAWTPTIESSGAAFPITYGIQRATFIRSGTIVQIQGEVTWTASAPVAGDLQIVGIPAALLSEGSGLEALINVTFDSVTYGAGNMVSGHLGPTSTFIDFRVTSNGAAATTLDALAAMGATGGIVFSGSYIQEFPTPP